MKPPSFLETIEQYQREGKLSEKAFQLALGFYKTYTKALTNCGLEATANDAVLTEFLEQVATLLAHPPHFGNAHEQITSPYDYYRLGVEMFRPMVDFSSSSVKGLEHVAKMEQQLAAKENVILLANHQSELDPQVLSLLLENSHPRFAKEMIFVAGDRVLTDPLAVPFSLGRNLFCIYSKRYIDIPPERKEEKLRHNQRSMVAMEKRLAAGGVSIYIAPSGGRDRPNAEGVVEVAPFDPQSLEMLFLTARKAETTTHFYPLALISYNLLPPPDKIAKELGEGRSTCFTPLHAAFGPEIDLEDFPGNTHPDKKERRQARARHLHSLVKQLYKGGV